MKEQAIQMRTDVPAQYGTTAYWLEKQTGCPNALQGDTHLESYRQVAVHRHGLDCLGLDSGGLYGFSDGDSDKYEAAKRAILNLDYCSFHDKRGITRAAIVFVRTSNVSHIGGSVTCLRCTNTMEEGVSWMTPSKESDASANNTQHWTY
jgi:hypothetical protein